MQIAADTELLEHFKHQRGALPDHGQAWLNEIRDRGLARFAELGLPGRKHENWKYTSVKPIADNDYWHEAEPVSLDPEQLAPFEIEGLNANRLVFVNGRYAAALSHLEDRAEGLYIGDLEGLLEHKPELAKTYFGRLPDFKLFPFAAINTGLATHGPALYVPEDTELKSPVHILFLGVESENKFSSHPRLLAVGGRHSRFELVEHYGSIGQPESLTNGVAEIFLEAGAGCRHTRLLNEADTAVNLGSAYIHQAADSTYDEYTVCLGGRLVRNDLTIKLAGAGAHCDLRGVYASHGGQHVDNHTTIEHIAPRCSSREFFKGVAAGKSHAVFNGRIHIHPGAQQTDAQLHNKNLLLSKTAEIDTKPELEIYADDVQCAHGATVGQLNEDEVYYLESRGIDGQSARAILTSAFINELVEQLPYAALRELVSTIVENRIQSVEQNRS